MPDGNEVIRYVIEVDTSSGKAAIREMLEGVGAEGGPSGGTGGTDASSFFLNNINTILLESLQVQGSILDAINGMADDIKKAAAKKPGKNEEDETFDLFKSVSSKIKAAGLGAAFAQTPGQMFAVAGAMLPEKTGAFVTAIGVATDKLIQLGLSIAEFNGELFAARTQWELFWMGWKIDLASEISDSFSVLLDQSMALAEDAMPIVITAFEFLANVLSLIIMAFRAVVNVLVFFVQAVQWCADMIIRAGAALATLGLSELTGIMPDSPTGALIDGISGLIEAINENTTELSMARKGQALMLGLFTAAESFGKMKPGFGIQDMQENVGEALDPTAPPKIVSERMAAMAHSEGVGGQMTGQSFPRPAPAAVDFKVTDQINVQAGDEEMMVQEMLGLKDQVLSMIQGIHDARWGRLREARAITMGSHFGVFGA